MEVPRPTEPWSTKSARFPRAAWLVLAALLLILTMIYTKESILAAVARAKHDGNVGDIEACTQVAQALSLPVETVTALIDDTPQQEAA